MARNQLKYISMIAIFVGLSIAFILLNAKGVHSDPLPEQEHAADTPKLPQINVPYKATTVEECIFEKECAWYAFEESLRRHDEDRDPLIKKWQNNIHALFLGPSEQTRNKFEEIYPRIAPFFPYDISTSNDGVTYVVVTSDNFKRAALTDFRDFFKMYLRDLPAQYFETYPDFYAANTLSLPMFSKEKEILGSILFVKDHLSSDYLITNNLYESLGFFRQFLRMPNIQDFRNDEIGRLHQLLLSLLYNDLIKPGMKVSQVKPLFDELYNTSIKKLEMESINDN